MRTHYGPEKSSFVNSKKAKSLSPAETLCPRWDSNCLLGLAITGLPRKHAESGAVQVLYEAVRVEKRGHCPHPLSRALEDYRGTRYLEISAAESSKSTVPSATPTTRSKPSSVVKACR